MCVLPVTESSFQARLHVPEVAICFPQFGEDGILRWKAVISSVCIQTPHSRLLTEPQQGLLSHLVSESKGGWAGRQEGLHGGACSQHLHLRMGFPKQHLPSETLSAAQISFSKVVAI